MDYLKSRPLSILGLFAIPLLIFLFWMSQYFPSLAVNGFQNIIIALEFISNESDVAIIFESLNPTLIESIDVGNRIDFGFMLVYSTFFFFLFRKLKELHQYEYATIGQVLAFVMLLGDAIENFQLFTITGAYPLADFKSVETSIAILKVATWSKWLSIASSVALVGGAIWENYNVAAKILSLVLSIPIILGGHSLVQLDASAIELFTASIFLSIGLLVISCFFLKPVILKTKIS
ncbi:MAG: hypothetical protein RIA69_19120 [Cyclobacteriaceae bacterium]